MREHFSQVRESIVIQKGEHFNDRGSLKKYRDNDMELSSLALKYLQQVAMICILIYIISRRTDGHYGGQLVGARSWSWTLEQLKSQYILISLHDFSTSIPRWFTFTNFLGGTSKPMWIVYDWQYRNRPATKFAYRDTLRYNGATA